MTSDPGDPNLLPRHAHRALLYIEKLNSVGVQPLAKDVDAYAVTDWPTETQYRVKLIDIFPIHLPPTKTSKAEPVTDWLIQMKWLTSNGDRVALSEMGSALLAALRTTPPEWSPEREGSSAIVLRPEGEDPFVYAELTRAIGQAGAATLVDPYFKADTLEWLHNATQVTRLLLSIRNTSQAREVELIGLTLHAMRENPHSGRVEIRPPSQTNYTTGTSSKTTTVSSCSEHPSQASGIISAPSFPCPQQAQQP